MACMSLCCCSSTRSSSASTEISSSLAMTTSTHTSINERLSAGMTSNTVSLSNIKWVTVDPTIDFTHSYPVLAPDGSQIMLPNNATGYGVQSEVAADSSNLTIDQETVNLSGCSTQSSADTTFHEAEDTEVQASSRDFGSSLKLILWTICALAACAVVLYLRIKFRK